MTKAERFKKRLQHRTYSEEQVAQIICPVGLTDVPGKLPMEVAVSIAGQLIAIENQDKQTPLKRGLAWKTLKQELGRDVDNETLGYRLKI
jgi:xanthine dehydrogenase accessory factor